MSKPIVLAVATCCREWTVAFGYQWGKCGLCGERPTYSHTLPESEWITPRDPIDQRSATLANNDEGS